MRFNLIGWTWQHSHIVNLGDRECLSLKTHKFVDVFTSSQIFIFLCFGAFFPGWLEGSLCVGFSGPTVHHLLPSSQSCTTLSQSPMPDKKVKVPPDTPLPNQLLMTIHYLTKKLTSDTLLSKSTSPLQPYINQSKDRVRPLKVIKFDILTGKTR